MTTSTDHRPGHSCRHLLPGAPVELTPTGLRPDPAVLLVEERDPRLAALIADRPHPVEIERSRTWSGLAAGDHPVQSCPGRAGERTHPARQVMLPAPGEPEADRTEKRLGRHEPDHGRGIEQGRDADVRPFLVLHADTQPHVRQWASNIAPPLPVLLSTQRPGRDAADLVDKTGYRTEISGLDPRCHT